MPGYRDREGKLYGGVNAGAGASGLATQQPMQGWPGVQPNGARNMSQGGLPPLPSQASDPGQVASPTATAASPGAQIQQLSQAGQPQVGAPRDAGMPAWAQQGFARLRSAQQAGQPQQPQQQMPGGIDPSILSQMTPEAALLMQRVEEHGALAQQQGQYDQAISGLQTGAAEAQQQVGEGVNIGEMMGQPGLDDRFWTAQGDLSEQKVMNEHNSIIERAKEQAIAQGWYGTGMWNQRLQELETGRSQALMGAQGEQRTERAGMMREDRYNRAQLEVQQAGQLAPYRSQFTYGAAQDAASLLTQRPTGADEWTNAYDWLQSHEGDAMQLMNPDGTMRAMTPAEEARAWLDAQNSARGEVAGAYQQPGGVPATDPHPWGGGLRDPNRF